MKSDFNENQFFNHVNTLIKFIVNDTKKANKHDVKEDIKHLKAEIMSRDKMLVCWSNLNDKCKTFLNQIIKLGSNSMKKYVKKPIPIHAFRWDGHEATLDKYITDPNDGRYFVLTIGFPNNNNCQLQIKSKEGLENCPVGDYVIRGIHGEYYPCDPKIFKESYKEVK